MAHVLTIFSVLIYQKRIINQSVFWLLKQSNFYQKHTFLNYTQSTYFVRSMSNFRMFIIQYLQNKTIMSNYHKLITRFQTNVSENYSENIEVILDSQILYDKKHLLGKGAYGEVYLGFNKKSKKLVAVKLVATTKDPNSFNFRSLQWQIQALQNIKGENVILYISHHYDLSRCFIVTELCQETLNQKLKKMKDEFKVISFQLVKEILLLYHQIIKGILVIHRAGYIHRDLKPENILIGIDLQPKIADFGLCGKISQACVTTQCKIGSKPYMSPEIIQYGQYSEQSDVWSLGVTLFQMLFSCHPFSDKFYENPSFEKYYDEFSIVRKKLKGMNTETKLSQMLLKIYDKLISQCLKVNSEKRISVKKLLESTNQIIGELNRKENSQKQLIKRLNPQKSERIYDKISYFSDNCILSLGKLQNKVTIKFRSFLIQAKSVDASVINDQKIIVQVKSCFKKLGSILKIIKNDKDLELYRIELQILENLRILIQVLSDKQNQVKINQYANNNRRSKQLAQKLLKFISVI